MCRLLDHSTRVVAASQLAPKGVLSSNWSDLIRDPIPSCTIAVRGDSEGEGKQVVSL